MSAIVYCPVCRTGFVSAGALYIHQVLVREITVSPYEFSRVARLAISPPRFAAKDLTSYVQV